MCESSVSNVLSVPEMWAMALMMSSNTKRKEKKVIKFGTDCLT